jgi:hypothetical protein
MHQQRRAENQEGQECHQFGALAKIKPSIAELRGDRRRAIADRQKQAQRQLQAQSIPVRHHQRERGPSQQRALGRVDVEDAAQHGQIHYERDEGHQRQQAREVERPFAEGCEFNSTQGSQRHYRHDSHLHWRIQVTPITDEKKHDRRADGNAAQR